MRGKTKRYGLNYDLVYGQQRKKDEGTLSVPASGDTKPTGKSLQIERSGSVKVDNHSADNLKIIDIITNILLKIIGVIVIVLLVLRGFGVI